MTPETISTIILLGSFLVMILLRFSQVKLSISSNAPLAGMSAPPSRFYLISENYKIVS